MELICEHCDKLITDDDMLELKYGLFIHASCEIEYYSGFYGNFYNNGIHNS